MTDDYAASLTTDPVEGDVFFEESIELSRRIRALKLWLSLRYHGVAAFRAAIADNLAQARLLADLVDQEADARADGGRPAERGVLPLGRRRPRRARPRRTPRSSSR